MDPVDFEGIFKWKFLIPGMYVFSWILMIIGPLLFPFAYQIYCVIIILYSLIKAVGLIFGAFVAVVQQNKTIQLLEKMKQDERAISTQQQIAHAENSVYHAIIIPSYKQQEEVLLQTLEVLAKSPRAKSQFIIFMAMEAHEKGSDQKARGLIEKTKQKFLYMGFSQHVIRNGQAKGKASNVSWCVQHLEQNLPRNIMVDPNLIMLTIIDADSWAPVEYFDVIQIQLKNRPQIRDMCMFSVPQIYSRNHLEVPVFNRVYDQMHSLVHLSNLVAVKFSFPLSNYSISYNCARRIGWWDTCADAIGEDFHTCQKCYWKFQKDPFITIPIYIPFNQFSLSTGEGYISDIKARFWQAQRHTLGVSDVAYNWHMLFKSPFTFRNLILTFLVTEVFAMAALIPWALLALGIQYKLVTNPTHHYLPMLLIDLIMNISLAFTVLSYVFYQWWKRVANTHVFKRENDKWWRVIEYPVLFIIALFGYSIPAFLMASFAVLCAKTQYKVAEKRMAKDKEAPQQVKAIQKVQSNEVQPVISTDSQQEEAKVQIPQKAQKKQKQKQQFVKQSDDANSQSAKKLKKNAKL